MTDLDLIYGTKPTMSPPTVSAEQKRDTAPPITPPPSPSKKSNKTEILTSKNIRNKASKQVSKSRSREETNEVSIEESILDALHTTDLKANTFRYTQEELDFIRDIVYEADVNYKTKLDKNDVARIGLEWLIVDWKANKETSLLIRILTKKKTRK